MVIIDLISRADKNMLLNICRKMINYLCLSGIKEAEEVLWDFGNDSRELIQEERSKLPERTFYAWQSGQYQEKTFRIASQHLK